MYCKGKMVEMTPPFSIDRNGYPIHRHMLRAWVCTQCGEAYFEKEEGDKIRKVLRAIDAAMDTPSKVA